MAGGFSTGALFAGRLSRKQRRFRHKIKKKGFSLILRLLLQVDTTILITKKRKRKHGSGDEEVAQPQPAATRNAFKQDEPLRSPRRSSIVSTWSSVHCSRGNGSTYCGVSSPWDSFIPW
jgi:hypothetical protein